MSTMADASLADRVSRLRPTAVNRVLQQVRQLEAEGRSLVSLMRGQPDTPTPGHIVEAAMRSLRDGRTGYPDNRGEPALRRAVAERLRRDQGLEYDPDREVLITDGATLGVCAALGALVEADTPVLLPDPIYDAYAAPIGLWGARPTPAPATRRDGRFTIGRRALEGCGASAGAPILLNTPWNPVGTVLTRAELEEIMGVAREHGSPVISDEIYEALVYDGRRHVSPAAVSADARGRAIVINSLSKTYAMTGWRVGYCAGPATIIRAMFLVLQQSSRGPATFVQDAAACALSSDQGCVRQMAAEYQARRDRVVERLRGIPRVEPMVPEGGLFVMVDIRGFGRPSEEVAQSLLREAGVVVLHGAAYGPGGEGTLRVSFAAGGETLERGLDRLREGLLRLASLAPREAEAPGGRGSRRAGVDCPEGEAPSERGRPPAQQELRPPGEPTREGEALPGPRT
jgi:aspartate aminotransferase